MEKKGHAKSAVMQTKYRMKVERDKTKYNKKQKHKGRTSDLCSLNEEVIIMWETTVDFSDLVGKTIVDISGAEKHSEEIKIKVDTGETYIMYHDQDCCECVTVDDICGDLSDVMWSPILKAGEVSNGMTPPGTVIPTDDSFTWTFYKLDTIKGGITIRWYGSSNGYYSERVSFKLIQEKI